MNSKLTGEGDADADVPKNSIAIFSYNQWLLSLDMKTKLVQHVPRIIFNIYKILKISKILNSGSQRLSDFQTFLAGNQLNEL